MIDEKSLKEEVDRLLGILYEKRFDSLKKLELRVLLNKNPYLYRSLGIVNPPELIEQLMAARVSSSDETIFGNCFLEPLALWAAANANSHGDASRKTYKGGGAGYDLAIDTATAYLAIAVKSGKNIFNSQSTKGQSTEFRELQARLRDVKKQFRSIIGYGYGRKKAPKIPTAVEKVAGQAFWELLTDEPDFYLKISRVIGEVAESHANEYREEYAKRCNLIILDFMVNFLAEDGSIAWDKVITFNSGAKNPSRLLRHGATTPAAKAPRKPRAALKASSADTVL